ncbi:MAG: SRPBCC family protein [Anaerolineaceae bacterium]
MKELCTKIEISASAEKVWQILTNFPQYPEWNPFITSVSGQAIVNEKVDVSIHSFSKKIKLHCTIVRVVPNKLLVWEYHVTHPILFRGEHHLSIEAIDVERVCFIDSEIFNGILVFTQAKDLDTNTKQGFVAMDQALKTRAERK